MTRTSDAKAALRQAMAAQQGQVAAVESAGQQVNAYVAGTCHLTLPTATSAGQ
jgi:hypothetical protein